MNIDKLIVLILFGLGIFVISYSYRIGIGKFSSPGPGLFPFLLGCLLFILSSYRLVGGLRRVQEKEEKIEGPLIFLKLILLLLCLLFFAIFLNTLGYILTTFITVALIFRVAGYTNWIRIILYSVIIVLISYFVFTNLGVRFPDGILRRF